MVSVLIVDDHPSFRALARDLLDSEGFDVAGEAEDGESALRAARSLRPEMVLMDVQLPDATGFEVTRQILAEVATTVVLVSTRDASDYGDAIAASGAAGFIPKAELSGARLRQLTGVRMDDAGAEPAVRVGGDEASRCGPR